MAGQRTERIETVVVGGGQAGLAVGYLFVRRQKQLADPMIDLRFFRDRSFSAVR